eukprot:CAMPEP_0197236038 /NCGR_PEP_ID=MMETSP1429-20130617/3313_1 /TAXON_ID=49237 /ORGANISM="Chaetoceros  sp., Strain UNC1202" /LENGTH=227 /DNA_ID=CAMNT_0042694779 /DNA_START=398 /DNA_END=1082 /DNA_ORIENTATION=-
MTYPTINKHRHSSNNGDGLFQLEYFAGRVAVVVNVAVGMRQDDLTYEHIKIMLEKYSSHYKSLGDKEYDGHGQAGHHMKGGDEEEEENGNKREQQDMEERAELQHEKDLVIFAFPTNDFHQEKGTNEEIEEVVRKHLGDQFDNPNFILFHKSKLEHNPIYKMLTRHMPEKQVRHNFYKYLIGRDGVPVAFYEKKETFLDMVPAILDELEFSPVGGGGADGGGRVHVL